MITSEMRDIPANKITVDPAVQRQLDERRVARIAAEWDDLAVGVLTVSQRKDGTIAVLDGQTRLAAFRQVCGESTTQVLSCQVYTGLVQQEEASMFLKHNNRKAILPRDRFRLALTAKEEWAVRITEIADKFGLTPASCPPGPNHRRFFSAVVAAERIYRLDDGVSLYRAFATIDSIWPGTRDAVCNETLYGLGYFYARHGEGLTSAQTRSLQLKLAKLGVNRLMVRIGDFYRTQRTKSKATAAYQTVLDVYNAGRKDDHRIVL